MRRLIASLPVLVLALAGCTHKSKSGSEAEQEGQLASVVNTADPQAAGQLTRGFYGIEGDGWRWTAKNFAVLLQRPAGAAQDGARLELKFAIPDVVLNNVGPVTLAAKVDGATLSPETFSKSGESTYARDVPAGSLSGETVTVEFSTDKALPPGGPPSHDRRELAIIVTRVGLLLK